VGDQQAANQKKKNHFLASGHGPEIGIIDICVTNNGCKLCPSYKFIAWTKIVQVIDLDNYRPSSFLQYVFHEFLCGHRPSY
jgi:hypothetical protein